MNGQQPRLAAWWTGDDGQQRTAESMDLWQTLWADYSKWSAYVNMCGVSCKCISTELMELEGSVAVCVHDLIANNELKLPCYIWVMRHKDGVVSWTRRFKVVMNVAGCPLKITKNGTLIIESWERIPNCGLVSCNLKKMHYKNLGFGGPSTTDVSLIENMCSLGFGGPSVVDASFIESLVLLEGGNTQSWVPK